MRDWHGTCFVSTCESSLRQFQWTGSGLCARKLSVKIAVDTAVWSRQLPGHEFLSLIVPKPNPIKHMKKTLAIAAATVLTSLSSQAAYILSADNGGSAQPVSSRVYGTVFTTNATTVLDKFAIYDYTGHEGDGWSSANAKVVSLFQLVGTDYSLIATKSFPTGPGPQITGLVGAEDFHVSQFDGLGALLPGTYYIALSEVKPISQEKFDGYVIPDTAVQNPEATSYGLVSFSFGRMSAGYTAVPVSGTFPMADVSTFNAVGVIPSLVFVPEAGSSVMALALGAMVVRFRSRRA